MKKILMMIFLKFQKKMMFIYCRSGRRSELTVRFLLENGFENVYNVNSGIIEIDSIYLDFRTLNN